MNTPTSRQQYLSLKPWDEKCRTINRAMTGHYNGLYWTQRAVDQIYEATGIRMQIESAGEPRYRLTLGE